LEIFKCSQYPQTQNPFKAGMKLEAIDPRNQHLICVCTIEEKLGHRIKLHFDGYPSSYDFWVDANSKNILPIEFCRTTKRELKIPPKWPSKNFDWSEYLDDQNCVGAQRHMFPHLQKKDERMQLVIGMKLEVRRDENWYAGTIVDIIGDRMLITFDGLYKNLEKAWYDFNSAFLRPCAGHNDLEDFDAFLPPSGVINFSWDEYLKTNKSNPVPASFFAHKIAIPNKFEPGMKLEVVDKVKMVNFKCENILTH
jgi:lethal(3)malignant brain tumor-like protein